MIVFVVYEILWDDTEILAAFSTKRRAQNWIEKNEKNYRGGLEMKSVTVDKR